MKTKTADTDANCVCEPRKGAGLRIFETARELFYKRGIRAVGVDEIVCQAGVTKPSLYRSYESKDALVAACLESYVEESCAEIDAAVEAAGDNPRDQLRAIVTHYAVQMTSPDFAVARCPTPLSNFPSRGILAGRWSRIARSPSAAGWSRSPGAWTCESRKHWRTDC